MHRTKIWFDGHCLTDYFHITNLQLPPTSKDVRTQSIPDRDGVIITSTTLQPKLITMQINAIDGDRDERIALLDMLSGWLNVNEPKKLEFSFHYGKYYMAIPQKVDKWKRWRSGDGYTGVTFICADPVRFGRYHEVFVSNSSNGDTGSVHINIDGTYPTKLDISADGAVRDTVTNLWAVSVDDQKFMKVATGSSNARKVDIDTDSRTLKVSDVVTVPTLDSDWFDNIQPGAHEVESFLGTGDYTVSWVDRWV